MKKNIIFTLTVLVLAVTVSCKQNSTNIKVNAELESLVPESAELKIWEVPNVTEGAEAYFSPDGKSLIFNGKMGEDESHFVYTVNIDGTNLKKINDKGEDACSYFNPNGQQLIWTSTRDNLNLPKGNYSDPANYPTGAELYLSDLDGDNVVRLTNNEYYDAEVTFSPNGEKILFGRSIDGMMDLWTMNPDGSNQKQITFTPEWQEGGAFFMNDNETIVYRAWKKSDQGQRGLPMTLFTIKEDGTDFTQLTSDDGTNWAPFPSPSGKYVAFVKVLPPHNYEIFLMNLETKEQRQLTFNEAFDGFPAISPDGKLLAFSSSRSAAPGERKLSLFLMDISSLKL